MSEEKPGIEISDLVRESLAQQGFMMTGMVGLVTFVNGMGEQMFALVLGDEDQSAIITQGMTTVLDKMVDALVRNNFPVG